MAKHPLPHKPTSKHLENAPELPEDPEMLKIAQLLQPLPLEKRVAILQQITSITMRSGPLPPPEDLEEYNRIIPNGADRIMTMAEKSQDEVIAGRTSERRLTFVGQNRGMILAILLILVAVTSQILGWDPWIARIIFGSLLIQLVSFFIKNPNHKTPESPAKNKAAVK